ncbi:hypothetical protein BBF96_12835 [Anoxybacter fermentans]|uniref:Uncharacterized protein n=1 Tax=Anoxybacter fermentans TaxID=1323375 RepID=A0A3S9T0T0_9FIRM|nr:hypothetical protein BBF96_12835 [Anoxybacter fermentans]
MEHAIESVENIMRGVRGLNFTGHITMVGYFFLYLLKNYLEKVSKIDLVEWNLIKLLRYIILISISGKNR